MTNSEKIKMVIEEIKTIYPNKMVLNATQTARIIGISLRTFSRIITNELLWFNGRQSASLGKLTYKESTEDDLIDWMYGIASMYYIRDIQPMEQERLKEQEKKEFKSSFAKNFFKL